MATPKLAELKDRALVRVLGTDWRSFLQGLLTQDVETIQPGELRFAALLTPQGRLLYDLFILGRKDGAMLDVQRAQRDGLVARLSMYRLRAKVEIAPEEGGVFALWDGQTAGPDWVRDPRLPELGFRGFGAPRPPEAVQFASADDYEAHRLSLGVPDPGKDCPDDRTYPIEANFDLLHGVDFKKGCFVGQETTSRMKRRGVVKTRMVPIVFEGPPPAFGAEVLAGGLRAGEVRSGRGNRALALLRLDRALNEDLMADGRPVRLDIPAWLGPALDELRGAEAERNATDGGRA